MFTQCLFSASAQIAMHSIDIGQLVWPVAAPLLVCMRNYKRGVAIVRIYPYSTGDIVHQCSPSGVLTFLTVTLKLLLELGKLKTSIFCPKM